MTAYTSAPNPGAADPTGKFSNSTKWGATFAPGITLNVSAGNRTNTAPAGKQPDTGQPSTLLPEPDFTSPAQLRNYCNSLRAAAVTLSIEVAMGSEILKGVLMAVPDPDGRLGGSRSRANRVARKLQRSAESLRSAAVNAAAAYSTFQQQYEEEINRVRHRARRPQGPRMDWAQQ